MIPNYAPIKYIGNAHFASADGMYAPCAAYVRWSDKRPAIPPTSYPATTASGKYSRRPPRYGKILTGKKTWVTIAYGAK